MVNSPPLVSVTITTFNRAHLLSNCVNSVILQDYPNIEIIIVDDHSSDNTNLILDELKAKNDNIRVIRHDSNKGNAYARNTAWRAAQGKYVAFLDDDDYWIDPSKLSVQIELLERASPNIGICCTQVKMKKNYDLIITPKEFPVLLKAHLLKGNGIIHNSTVVVPREILEKLGGFDERMPRGIDSEFYRNVISKNSYDALFIPKVTTYYENEAIDRITTRNGFREAKRLLIAHSYLLWKYRWQYILYPRAMLVRIKHLISTPLKSILW